MAIPKNLLEGIDSLDPMPFTVQQLIVALDDEDTSFGDIGKIIEYDAAIAANILRIANTTLYAGRTRIEEIPDAVVRLGTATLLNIVLGDHLKDLVVSAPLYDLSEDELWLHSAVSSLAAAEIQKAAKVRVPRTAAIAALLHDIGKLIMVRYLDCNFDRILELCQDEKVTWVEAERRMFGCDHAQVGGAMARKWSFPEPIAEAIEYHHSPSPNAAVLLDTVVVANLIAKTNGVGLGAQGFNFECDQGSAQRLGIDFKSFCRSAANTAVQIAVFKESWGVSA